MAEEKPMIKYIEPDRYDGKGDIRDFFTRFEECAKNNRWTEDMKKLKAAFEKRYLKNKEKIMNKINSRMMGENEEIEDYYSEMVELCYEADEHMSEGQIVKYNKWSPK